MQSENANRQIAVWTALFTVVVTLSQFIFSVESNGDISHNNNPCSNATGVTAHADPEVIDWLSALAFQVVTFPVTLFYLYKDVASWSDNTKLTRREQHYKNRHAKRNLLLDN